jgi:putative transposase
VGGETLSYRGFRYPAEIISHCVWLYHRFSLSLREVREMMAQRGVVVSQETVRRWCSKWGQTYAMACAGLARGTCGTSTRYSSRSTVRSTIGGGRWTARQRRRHSGHLPTGHQGRDRVLPRVAHQAGVRAWVLVTDKLASYHAARRRVPRSVEHRQSTYLNNRAENSAHQPTRAREQAMTKFTSAGHAQRFLSAFSGISPHLRPRRHRLTAEEHRCETDTRFTT